MKNISQEMEPLGVQEAVGIPLIPLLSAGTERSLDPSYLDIPAEPTSLLNHSAPLLCHKHLTTAVTAPAVVTIGK